MVESKTSDVFLSLFKQQLDLTLGIKIGTICQNNKKR